MTIGSKVMIISGSHKGLEGKVLAMTKKKTADHGMSMQKKEQHKEEEDEVDPDSYVSVELRAGGSKVEIKRKRLELKNMKKRNRSRSRDNSPTSFSRNTGVEGNHHHEESKKASKPLKWVTEGIQVRVVSKKVADGRLYNKVLPVMTVLDRCTFEVFSEELNCAFTYLREKDIETVLPRSKDLEGSREKTNLDVIILKGEYKGQIGTVRSIDKKKDKVEILVDYVNIATVSQDDCSLKVN